MILSKVDKLILDALKKDAILKNRPLFKRIMRIEMGEEKVEDIEELKMLYKSFGYYWGRSLLLIELKDLIDEVKNEKV